MAARGKRRAADAARPVGADPRRSELECKLSEINVEVDRRCDKLQADAEHVASALRSAFAMQVTKLPRRIRSMKMKDFIEQCGGNVMQAMAMLPRAGRAAGAPRGPAAMATVARPQARARAPVATARRPAGGPRAPLGAATGANARSHVPKTPGAAKGRLPAQTPAGARLARADEVFISANGSPVVVAGPPAAAPATGVRATVGKSRNAVSKVRRGADKRPPSDAVAIDVAIADGREVDLARPEVQAALTAEDKEAARAKLLALQSQLSSILTSLDG